MTDGTYNDDDAPAEAAPTEAAQTAAEPVSGGTGGTRRLGRRGRIALVVVGGSLLSVLALFGVGYAMIGVPAAGDVVLSKSTALLYTDGSVLAEIGKVNRTVIPLSQVPVPIREAVLAAEDRNYYSEPGVSMKGTVRALAADVVGMSIKQGGSTITQQYVKNAFLSQERSFTRKFREAIMAVKLDRKYSKDQVLEWYLNTIYFGRGAFGIEEAAKTYFGVPAKQLKLEQGIALAGLIRSPALLDPTSHKSAAKVRWQQVTNALVKWGKVSEKQAKTLHFPTAQPISKDGAADTTRADLAYLRDAIYSELIDRGVSEDRIQSGGLRVRTTVDKAMQDKAVAAVERYTRGGPSALQTGLVSIDPKSGAIRASYGGSKYGHARAGEASGDFKDNVFYSRNPAGSSFKPIVLAAALAKGIKLDARYDGHSPKEIPDTTYQGGEALRNFNSEQYGSIDLVTATQHSVNTVYVPLALEAGLKEVVKTAHAMGIPAAVKLPELPSTALGVSDARAVDMASVYATFASRGIEHDPYLVAKVTSRSGNDIYTHKSASHRAIKESVADDATFAMESVLNGGTGTAATLALGRPGAGKTGTTSDNTAAWFCGFTPQLATASVMFFDDGAKPLRGILGYDEVTGGTLPALIWKAFTDAALDGQPALKFAGRGKVEYVAPPSVSPLPSASASPKPSRSPAPKRTTDVSSPPPIAPSPSTAPQPEPSPSAPAASPAPSPAAAGASPAAEPAQPPAAGESG